MIELLIGPYRSGKTGRLLQDLLDYKQSHPLDTALILVPSARYGRLLKSQLTKLLSESSRENGLFNLHILTLYQACELVLQKASLTAPIVQRDMSIAIIRDVLRKLNQLNKLRHLNSICQFTGTAPSLFALFDEFERAALSPQNILKKLSASASHESRHNELATVYEHYWLALDKLGCLDQKRAALKARDILRTEKLPHFHLRFLLIEGFDRISPLQADLFHAFSEHAELTKFSFDYVLSPGSDEPVEEYKWKQSSFNEIIKRFSVKATQMPSVPSITAPEQAGFAALDRFIEMKEIARRCKIAIVSGVRPDQILIAVRNLNAYRSACKSAFEDAGLEAYMDDSVAAATLPIVQFLLQLLSLPVHDFVRRDVANCLNSPFLDPQFWSDAPAIGRQLDERSLQSGLVGGYSQWMELLDGKFQASLKEKPAEFLDALLQAVHVRSCAEHCSYVEDLLERFVKLPSKRESGRTLSAYLEREGLRCFRQALAKILFQEELLKSPAVPFEAFLSQLGQLLESTTFPTPVPGVAAVTICGAEQAANRRYDLIYVAGVVESEFPRRPAAAGFVSADEVARWLSFGIFINNPRQEAGFEQALFRSLIERARQTITFSRPLFEMNGDEPVPSFYFVDGTININPEQFQIADGFSAGWRAPVSVRDAIASHLWKVPGMAISSEACSHPDLATFWNERIKHKISSSFMRLSKDTSTPFNGYLSDFVEMGDLQVDLPEAWSATALSLYAHCPFKYWMTKVLRLEPRIEPLAGLSPLIKGVIYHKTLELYFARFSALPAEDRQQASAAILKQAFDQAIDEAEEKLDFTPGIYWRNEKQDMQFRLTRFVADQAEKLAADNDCPQPWMFEVPFGMEDSTYPALIIDTRFGPVHIRGTIDRVDLLCQSTGSTSVRARVIDYKTGSESISLQQARDGVSPQLPLYAMAFEQVISPGSIVSNGQYLGVNACKQTGSITFNTADTADLQAQTKKNVETTIAGVAAGDFSVRPYDPKKCDSCDHNHSCRVGELAFAATYEDE